MVRSVRTVPASVLICNKLVDQALRGHEVLSEEDIAFGANYVCSLGLNPEKLALVLLMMSKHTNTGRFALSFNHELDNALKIRDVAILRRILSGENYLVEIYDNPDLTETEKATIERMLAREYQAIRETLNQGEPLLARGQLDPRDLLDPCPEVEGIMAQVNDHRVSLYTRCYDQVCLRETLPGGSQIPSVIYTVDQPLGSAVPHTFCFETMELVAALVQEVPVNPVTRQPFSELALSLLLPRFAKEIKLYRRYLKQLHSVGLAA